MRTVRIDVKNKVSPQTIAYISGKMSRPNIMNSVGPNGIHPPGENRGGCAK
jgi:FtsP/CotA-like multicopper oxidase with cupredoxin domain